MHDRVLALSASIKIGDALTIDLDNIIEPEIIDGSKNQEMDKFKI